MQRARRRQSGGGDIHIRTADQFDDTIALRRLVFHHQQILHLVCEKIFHACKRLIQRFLVRRFLDPGQCPKFAATFVFSFCRNDVHGDMTCGRLMF